MINFRIKFLESHANGKPTSRDPMWSYRNARNKPVLNILTMGILHYL